jgi:hypothetical protein
MAEEQKPQPEHSKESEYFAKLFTGHESGVQMVIDSVVHSLTLVNFSILSQIVAHNSGHDPEEIRKKIIDSIFKLVKNSSEKQIQQHTAMCEGNKVMGMLIQSLAGDGESIRLKAHKDIKAAREIFEKIVVQHDPNNLEQEYPDAQD